MKKLIIFCFLPLLILSCESCKEEVSPILNGCGHGFELSEDKTECICPPDGHFLLTPIGREYDPRSGNTAGSLCALGGEYVYYVQFEEGNCIDGLSADYLALNPIGLWTFTGSGTSVNDFSVSIYFIDGPSAEFGTPVFPPAANTGVTVEKLDDGRVEVSFVTGYMFVYKCYDWKDDTERVYVRGFGHGISNEDNTKIEIEIVYKDTDGFALDTSYAHLWKGIR